MNIPFFKIELIWKDPHLCEFEVSASNKSFCGKSEVYDIRESLLEFSNSLTNYPFEKNMLFYEAGKSGGYSYFSIRIYQIDSSGKTGVEINIEKK